MSSTRGECSKEKWEEWEENVFLKSRGGPIGRMEKVEENGEVRILSSGVTKMRGAGRRVGGHVSLHCSC